MTAGFETFRTGDAPQALGAYSPAVAPTLPGYPVFLSGQSGRIPGSHPPEIAGNGSIDIEIRQVFANIKAVLTAARLSLADVLQVRVYLKNMDHFQVLNSIWAEEFGAHKPARTTAGVHSLPLPAINIEMEVVAWKPQNTIL